MTVTNRIQYGTMKQEQEGFVKQRSNKEGYPWCKSFLALG
jgi:hypothetical protein